MSNYEVIDVQTLSCVKIRKPYLMVDYVYDVMLGKSIRGIKHLLRDEWFFKCHFEGYPIMPGVLQAEAIMQTGLIAINMIKGNESKIAKLRKIEKLELFAGVFPESTLEIYSEIDYYKRGVGKMHGTCHVDGQLTSCVNSIFVIEDDFLRI